MIYRTERLLRINPPNSLDNKLEEPSDPGILIYLRRGCALTATSKNFHLFSSFIIRLLQLLILFPYRMLMPKKNLVAIYEHLFKEGVMVAKKDTHLPKHPEIDVPNLQVMKTLNVS